MKFLKYFDAPGKKCERICRKSGDATCLQRILQRNPNLQLNQLLYDNNDKALIHLATLSGFCKCVEVLLEHGANPGTRMVSTGNTCLHVASWSGSLDTLKVLCSHSDVNLDEISEGGFTALALSCWAGHLDVCKFLLSVGASPRVPNRHGYTPLLLASRCGAVDVVEHLLVSGACDVSDVDHDGCTALHHACFEGRKNLIRLLVKQGVVKEVKDRKGRTAKDLCKTREISDLLKSVQAINAITRKRTTFQFRLPVKQITNDTKDFAMEKMSSNTSQSLVSELSYQYLSTALPSSATEKSAELSQAHVFSPPHMDAENRKSQSEENASDDEEMTKTDGVGLYIIPKLALECWRLCTSSGDYRAFKRLLTAHSVLTEGKPSALSHLRDVAGWSLLMRASDNGFLEIVKILLSVDPETISVTCPHGRTALYLSAANNHELVTRILLSAIASQMNTDDGFVNLDHVTSAGRTALHAAAEFGHVDIARLLLYRGANENAQDNEGFTPLHLACQYSKNEMVIFLVTECSADPLILTLGGEIAEDLASSLRVKALLRAVISHRKKDSTDDVEYSHGSVQAWNAVEMAIATLRRTTPADISSLNELSRSPPKSPQGIENKFTGHRSEQMSVGNSADFKSAAWNLISQKSKKMDADASVGFSRRSAVSTILSTKSLIPSAPINKEIGDYSGNYANKDPPQIIKMAHGASNIKDTSPSQNMIPAESIALKKANLPLRARLKEKYRMATDFTKTENISVDLHLSVRGSSDDSKEVSLNRANYKTESSAELAPEVTPHEITLSSNSFDKDMSSTPPAAFSTLIEEEGMLSEGKELKGSLLLTLILSQVYNVYSNKISRAFYRWKYRNQGQTKSPRGAPSRF